MQMEDKARVKKSILFTLSRSIEKDLVSNLMKRSFSILLLDRDCTQHPEGHHTRG